jgi:predicted phage terminase large subunit-like protein
MAELTLEEMVKLGAADPEFFAHAFFPKTYRQASPLWSPAVWGALDDPRYRLVNLSIFRGGAKTTRLRTFTAKRIAYQLSRTILYVGASEGHAARSVQWLRTQITKNKLYADTFGLSPGRKWTDTECEIVVRGHEDEPPIWILGAGITGNIRGINFDDYRPDLIVLDDVITDENAATKEQREKIIDLILGAIKNSLISEVEEPNAKLVMLQTPIHSQDASAMAAQDPQWHTERFSCWTQATADLPTELQESAWPEMFPTKTLRADKTAAINRNRYSVFAREMECKLVTSEEAAFRPEWLQEHTGDIPQGTRIVVVDPVPPPSDRELERSLATKDFEVVMVLCRANGNYYVVEYEMKQGHTPDWTVNKVLEYANKHRVTKIVVEAVAYQRTLIYLLQREMALRRSYHAVVPYNPKGQKKYNRIMQTIMGPASNGVLYVGKTHTELKAQFAAYPKVDHDDVLDALSIGLADLANPIFELGEGDYVEIDESTYPDLEPIRRAP